MDTWVDTGMIWGGSFTLMRWLRDGVRKFVAGCWSGPVQDKTPIGLFFLYKNNVSAVLNMEESISKFSDVYLLLITVFFYVIVQDASVCLLFLFFTSRECPRPLGFKKLMF